MEIHAPLSLQSDEVILTDQLLPPDTNRGPAEKAVVKLGRPRWWTTAKMGSQWQPPAGNDRYGLAEFVYSLDPNNTRFSQLEFEVQLHPDNLGRQPIFYDVFPRDQQKPTSQEIKITLSPKIKFAQLDASLITTETSIHFKKIEAVIQVIGIGTETIKWTFQPHAELLLQGCQAVYAVVQIQSGMERVRATLDLHATQRTRFGALAFSLGAPSDHRTFTLE